MLEELGKLEELGRLKNFTALADALMRVDATLDHIEDRKALYRVALLLDSVFSQAYRGEKSMAFLTDRMNSLIEVLELMAMKEPQPERPSETEPQPAAVSFDSMWKSPNASH